MERKKWKERKRKKRKREGEQERRKDDMLEKERQRTGFPRGEKSKRRSGVVYMSSKEGQRGLLRERKPVSRFKLE